MRERLARLFDVLIALHRVVSEFLWAIYGPPLDWMEYE